MANVYDARAAREELAEQWMDHVEISGIDIAKKDGEWLIKVFIEDEIPDNLPKFMGDIKVVPITHKKSL
jgi:hypothetical protein